MLKKIFKRNKRGLKRKKSKSKSKLNISNDNIDTKKNNYSFIENEPNMSDDDDEIVLPKLNFTCILNNPLEDINNTSIFGQLLMRFQEDQRIVTEEERIKKEGYKFDIIDIMQDKNENFHNNSFVLENKIFKKLEKEGEEEEEELDDILNDLEQLENIFSGKKSLEQCIKETNEELFKGKKTFKLKKFVDLSYNNYIAKIKHEYLIYRDYHKNNIMKKIILDDLSNNNIKIGNKEEILKTVNNYRKNLNESMKLIDKEYKVDTNNFKINDNLLNMDINQIMENTIKIIEQKGIIELEEEKSKINYNIIKYFFKNNYPILINEVNNVHFKIGDLIEKKNYLKSKFIDATIKLIMMKLKRQNLFKLNNIYKKMLDANCNKIENIDSIIEIKEMKLKLKNIPNISLNIIKKINEELKIREANKNLEIINKITTLIKNEINNCFDIETYNNQNEEEEEEEEDEDIEINPKKKYNYKYYNIDEKVFKKIFKYKNNKEIIFLVINSMDLNFIKEKIYSLLDLVENKIEYMQKVCNVVLSSIEQTMLTTLGKILPLKNLNEILYLFYIGKMSQVLLESINKMFEEKDKEKLILDVNNTLFDIIDKNLCFIVNDLSSYNQNIDKFIIKNEILKEVYAKIPIFLSSKIFSEKIDNYELNFIDNFGKVRCEKITDELNCDNLRNLDNFSYEYQKLVNIIFSFNNESIDKDKEKKIEDLKNNILLDIDLNLKKNEQKEINLLEIPNTSEGKNNITKCKLITTTLDLITDTIYTIKMLLFFNKNSYNKILLYLSEIFYNFVKTSGLIVLEAKGKISNITQNEIASSYSSVYLIKEITSKIILFLNNSNDINEETKTKYKDLEVFSQEYLDKNLLKLKNLIQDGINENSLNEFKKIINYEKYPVISKENKGNLAINIFALNLVKLVNNVNKSLKYNLEDKIIRKIFLDNLNNFNAEIEKLLDKKELNDEEEKTQFKRDFMFIKKNIDNGIEDIDKFKKKLTSVYKNIIS
jgi:hypothetical protein